MIRIKELRTSLGYTQDKLAKLLRVSRTTVAMWETGGREPDYDILVKLTNLFNIPADFIVGAGVFKNWDEIIRWYDDVVHALKKLIPADLYLPSFSDEKTLIAWLDTRLYNEFDELQLIRWFSYAIKGIELSAPYDDGHGHDVVDADITFTQEFLYVINSHLGKTLNLLEIEKFLADSKISEEIPGFGDLNDANKAIVRSMIDQLLAAQSKQ